MENSDGTADARSDVSPVLEMRNISKTFPGVKALQNVELTIYPGEVHALMGENGMRYQEACGDVREARP